MRRGYWATGPAGARLNREATSSVPAPSSRVGQSSQRATPGMRYPDGGGADGGRVIARIVRHRLRMLMICVGLPYLRARLERKVGVLLRTPAAAAANSRSRQGAESSFSLGACICLGGRRN